MLKEWTYYYYSVSIVNTSFAYRVGKPSLLGKGFPKSYRIKDFPTNKTEIV